MSLNVAGFVFLQGSNHFNANLSSFHEMMYTSDGKRTMDRLWEETLQELGFAGVRDIVVAPK